MDPRRTAEELAEALRSRETPDHHTPAIQSVVDELHVSIRKQCTDLLGELDAFGRGIRGLTMKLLHAPQPKFAEDESQLIQMLGMAHGLAGQFHTFKARCIDLELSIQRLQIYEGQATPPARGRGRDAPSDEPPW